MSWNGKKFYMLKFHTMPVDTEAKIKCFGKALNHLSQDAQSLHMG
jgi:lipopolysaccharide/colanic/teichoic acid biosynthesis glycosyltransferase